MCLTVTIYSTENEHVLLPEKMDIANAMPRAIYFFSFLVFFLKTLRISLLFLITPPTLLVFVFNAMVNISRQDRVIKRKTE